MDDSWMDGLHKTAEPKGTKACISPKSQIHTVYSHIYIYIYIGSYLTTTNSNNNVYTQIHITVVHRAELHLLYSTEYKYTERPWRQSKD